MPASRRGTEPLRRAVASFRTGDIAEAARWAAAAVEAAPGHFDALHLAGLVAARRGRYDEALALCDRALALRPDSADTLNCRGGALTDLGRHVEALEAFDRALVLRPDHVQALNNRGNALKALGRFDEALADFDGALAGSPLSAAVLNNRGTVLSAMRRYAEALPWFERALQIDPDFAEAHANRGTALFVLRDSALALDSLDRALQLKPDLVVALQVRGSLLGSLGRHREAGDNLERALKIVPRLRFAQGALLNARMACCDWRDCAELSRRVAEDVRNGQPRCVPFAFLGISDSSDDQLVCARTWVRDECPPAPVALWTGERYRHERIRVAYLSADFREHATSSLAVGLFEFHDRSRFDVTAISFGAATPGPMRARVTAAFETFIDVRRMDDHEAADRIRKREIDIAVDLGGFTRDCRTGILARRPAPIQVNYLGYPGHDGGRATSTTCWRTKWSFHRGGLPLHGEGSCYLPDTYQPNDSRRRIAERTPTRAEVGLPEPGFVFCSFNNSYKITPAMFDVWMRLLRAGRRQRALAAAGQRGGAATICAGRQGAAASRRNGWCSRRGSQAPNHLARHRLADLFLDTLPYNAHTTASDALWAGVPVLTCAGSTFAGRVAASLLRAIGLPELVTHVARRLRGAGADAGAPTPQRLAGHQARSSPRNRDSHPLFDTDRFRRHIEAAYVAMWERQQRGEPPASFAVEPITRPAVD